MSYSCMNGRLRALPLQLIEPKVEHSKLDDDNTDILNENNVERDSEPCKTALSCNPSPRYFSTIPNTLPHGLVTIHPVPLPISESTKGDEKPCASCDGDNTLKVQKIGSNIAEIHRSMGNVVIDHCWSWAEVGGKGAAPDSEEESLFLVFALLGKIREGVVHIQEEKNTTTLHALSTLHLYWREAHTGIGGTGRDDDSIDESFTNECSLAFPYTATNICMNESLLLVGSSMGATAYKIHDIIERQAQSKNTVLNLRHDAIPNLKIMNTFIVHAMDISSNYFAASSGDKLAIWPVDKIVEAIGSRASKAKPTAAWGTKLQGKSRITCIQLSKSASGSKDSMDLDGRYVALADWNGSGVVFQKYEDHQGHKCKWRSIINNAHCRDNKGITDSIQLDNISTCNDPSNVDDNKASCSWEEAFTNDEDRGITSPTFISMCDVPNGTESLSSTTPVMAMSCPGSPNVRLYHLERPSISCMIKVGQSESGEVQGLASFRTEDGQCSLLIIDESDCMFQLHWSKYLDQCTNSEK